MAELATQQRQKTSQNMEEMAEQMDQKITEQVRENIKQQMNVLVYMWRNG